LDGVIIKRDQVKSKTGVKEMYVEGGEPYLRVKKARFVK